MSKMLIKNVNIIDLPADKTVNIGVEDDKIVFISENVPQDFQAQTVIDGKDKLATPGLVNTHTHAAMTLLRSYADDMNLMDWLQNKIWPVEAKLDGDKVYWGTMLAIAEMLKFGVTTFADMYFFMEDVAKAVEQTGIRAVLSRGLSGDANSDGKSIAENEALYKNWHNKADGRITVMFGPHSPYTCSDEFIKKVIAASEKLDAGIHIHLAETNGEVQNCLKDKSKTPIAIMNDLGLFERPTIAAHCTFINDDDMQIMKEKNVSVAHNPQSNLKLGSGIAPAPRMLEKGLTVGLGTDGASSNNNQDLFEEMRLVSILHKGNTQDPLVITAKESFDMATVQGAKALKLENIGELKQGCKADIVLFDMKKPHWYPKYNLCQLFVYAGQAADVDTVIVNGKVLLENGKLTTIDEEKLYHNIDKCVKSFGIC